MPMLVSQVYIYIRGILYGYNYCPLITYYNILVYNVTIVYYICI